MSDIVPENEERPLFSLTCTIRIGWAGPNKLSKCHLRIIVADYALKEGVSRQNPQLVAKENLQLQINIFLLVSVKAIKKQFHYLNTQHYLFTYRYEKE